MHELRGLVHELRGLVATWPCLTWPPPLPPATADFNLSKVLEGAQPEGSLATAGATNPIWLVGAACDCSGPRMRLAGGSIG